MRPIDNPHRVEPDVWDRWSVQQRQLFTELFERMTESPWAFQHPQQKAIPKAHWETIAWNAAWMAADMLKGIDWVAHGIRDQVMYTA